jgi:hypothetical protein
MLAACAVRCLWSGQPRQPAGKVDGSARPCPEQGEKSACRVSYATLDWDLNPGTFRKAAPRANGSGRYGSVTCAAETSGSDRPSCAEKAPLSRPAISVNQMFPSGPAAMEERTPGVGTRNSVMLNGGPSAAGVATAAASLPDTCTVEIRSPVTITNATARRTCAERWIQSRHALSCDTPGSARPTQPGAVSPNSDGTPDRSRQRKGLPPQRKNAAVCGFTPAAGRKRVSSSVSNYTSRWRYANACRSRKVDSTVVQRRLRGLRFLDRNDWRYASSTISRPRGCDHSGGE